MSFSSQTRHIHFIGIGGIGMSGLAELVLKLGHKVSGSDLSESETVKRLRERGAQIQIGHRVEIFSSLKPDVVVYSTAVKSDNAELRWAIEHFVPVIRRAEMLAEIMRLKRGIAVAGSHGKTTTTGLLSLLLQKAGVDPTVVIGGRFNAIGSNAYWGGGAWIVAEADESDGSFLRLSPELAIVTNIDREHLDHYGTFDKALNAFEDFIDRLPFYGRAFLCSDCPHLRALSEKFRKPRLWYGFEKEFAPDCWVKLVEGGRSPRFELYYKKDGYARAQLKGELSVPGNHNVLNAAAASLAALELGVSAEVIEKALKEFKGVQRRFEHKGDWGDHPLIEDYAHHPTEIRATLSAACEVYGVLKPWVIFQPHRYSRTRDLWTEFATCFDKAAQVLTLPIYPASEPREGWVANFDGESFSANIKAVPARAFENREQLKKFLIEARNEKKIPAATPIFILGAGDVNKIAGELLSSSS